jgi:hypothetical protein
MSRSVSPYTSAGCIGEIEREVWRVILLPSLSTGEIYYATCNLQCSASKVADDNIGISLVVPARHIVTLIASFFLFKVYIIFRT